MTPAAYFDELVAPEIADFEAAPDSIRRAYAACMFAYHFADAVHVHCGEPLADVRQAIATHAQPERAFWIIEGIALMAKHLAVKSKSVRMKMKPEDTQVRREFAFDDGTDFDDGTGWSDPKEVVMTKDDTSRLVDVRQCLLETRRAIEAYLTGRPELGWPQAPAPVEEQVELRQERVRIERRADDPTFEERTIELVERGEEAVVSKTARVVEEIVVGKEVVRETETVRDTVRRQDVEVDDDRGLTIDDGKKLTDETGDPLEGNPDSTR